MHQLLQANAGRSVVYAESLMVLTNFWQEDSWTGQTLHGVLPTRSGSGMQYVLNFGLLTFHPIYITTRTYCPMETESRKPLALWHFYPKMGQLFANLRNNHFAYWILDLMLVHKIYLVNPILWHFVPCMFNPIYSLGHFDPYFTYFPSAMFRMGPTVTQKSIPHPQLHWFLQLWGPSA